MNVEKYKEELADLIERGSKLFYALQYECNKGAIKKQYEDLFRSEFPDDSDEKIKIKTKKYLKGLPVFTADYQSWYSESLVLLKQLLPVRCDDFISLYKKPKSSRKDITSENYVIEDALQGIEVTRAFDQSTIVGRSAALPRVKQQLEIVRSVERRLESSLFDIRALVAADVYDNEIEAAKGLYKSKFYRSAGAICGVIIEKHLAEVCKNHGIPIRKKNPTIADFNDAIKASEIIGTPQWRKIQYLADIRNKCTHNKTNNPTPDEVQDLIDGTAKLIKTLF